MKILRDGRGALPRTHLLDPTFTRIDRTYCGLADTALTSPVTTDLDEATCKVCVKTRLRLDQQREALAIGPVRETMRGTEPGMKTCCGMPMSYYEVFGIRVYHCQLRHHPVIYENLRTGEERTDEDLERKLP